MGHPVYNALFHHRHMVSFAHRFTDKCIVLIHLVDQMDEHNAFICEAMCKAYHVPMVEQSVVHWMSHSQIDMFIFMVTHIDDEEEALRFAEKGVKYLLAGWYGLVRP